MKKSWKSSNSVGRFLFCAYCIMSGQPLVKVSDAKKFRNAYLKTLALQEANNEKNLKANELFKKTGEPQQPLDTRSTAEKLKDIENLKPEIRSQLLELMDGTEAEKVVQNVSSNALEYLAQAMPSIVAQLQPRYQRGMLADIFIAELNRMIYEDAQRIKDSQPETSADEMVDNFKTPSKGGPVTPDFGTPNDEELFSKVTESPTAYIPVSELSATKVTLLKPYVKIVATKIGMELPPKLTKTSMINFLTTNDEAIQASFEGRPSGKGFHKKKLGVPADQRYIPLGRYVIHKRQLDKDIVSIKTKTGKQIMGFNAHLVSRNLGGAIRKIVGGGSPTFDEIASLSDDEKQYLHKVASKAEIIDRLSIPAPNKHLDEKDINQFEIMKGEILAGNDNKDLIKKFKLLILKLVRKELIPKREANDMLFELTSLGY